MASSHRRSCPRYALAGSRSHLRRGSSGYVDFARLLCVDTQAGAFFVTRAKSNIDAHRVYSAPFRIARPAVICDQTISLDDLLHPSGLPRTSAAKSASSRQRRVRQDAGLHHQQLLASGRHHLRALQKPSSAGGTLRSSGSSSIFGSSSSTARRRTRSKTQIWIAVSALRRSSPTRQGLGAPRPATRSLYTLSQILSVTLFEKMPIHRSTCGRSKIDATSSQITQPLNLFDF